MKRAVLEKVDEMLSWPESLGYEGPIRRIRTNGTFFADAPLAIAVLTKPYEMPIDRELLPKRGWSFEQTHRLRADPGIQSVGAAIENMLLMTHALGYGACWMTGPLFAGPSLERILGVREPWRLAAIIPVGVPAQPPSPTKRKALEEILTVLD